MLHTFYRLTKRAPHVFWFYIATMALFGTATVFNVPAMAGNDDIAHLSRAYEISKGKLVTHKFTAGNDKGNLGGAIPHAFTDMDGVRHQALVQGVPLAKAVTAQEKRLQNVTINQSDLVEISYSNSALYSPLSYLPQAFSVYIARALDLGFLQTVHLTRLVVLFCCIITTALAILIAPTKKWFFATVGLMPMVVQVSAGLSSDGLLVSSCLLFVASYLYVLRHNTLGLSLGSHKFPIALIFFATITYASLAKPVYFPLFLVLALLPTALFRTFKNKILFLTVTLFIPFMLLASWNAVAVYQDNSSAQRLSVSSVGIHPPESTTEGLKILADPGYTVPLLVRTYVNQLSEEHDIPNYITQGFFGLFTSYYVPTPVWYTLTVSASLVLALFLSEKLIKISRLARISVVAAYGIAGIGITFSMFFITTTAGQGFINGIQGRYFLPLLAFAPILLMGTNFIAVANRRAVKMVLVIFIATNLLYMQWILQQWFH